MLIISFWNELVEEKIFPGSYLDAQLQKVFLPPGSGFLRRNFPNIDDEFY